MLLIANGIDYSDAENTGIFLDLVEGDWQTNVAYKAFALGITAGYDDGTFKADKPIKRIQAIKFLLKANGVELTDTEVSLFIDVTENWMKKYTNKAKDLGIINGEDTPDGPVFRPDDAMTRGEAAKVIVKPEVDEQIKIKMSLNIEFSSDDIEFKSTTLLDDLNHALDINRDTPINLEPIITNLGN